MQFFFIVEGGYIDLSLSISTGTDSIDELIVCDIHTCVAKMGQLLARCSKTVICVCALVCVALAFVSMYYMWSRCGPTGGETCS